MLQLRPANERGMAEHGWLTSHHTFSFADYHDPAQMGFGDLRVINEDTVQPSQGFGAHPHRDMEIISYVLTGALEHKDNMGNVASIVPGDVQRMSAGTGVVHSEYNASDKDPVHFFQIWVLPDTQGIDPGYEQKAFSDDEKRNQLRLVASRDGRDGSIIVHQDLSLYASLLDQGAWVTHRPEAGRRTWIQLASGAVTVNGKDLSAGDGIAVSDESEITISAKAGSEFLLFDLA
ncbi:MAG: pirin family protein [Proteobacteria bacterium]|nr:pirin family protein [Pseudomonadota bacterium]